MSDEKRCRLCGAILDHYPYNDCPDARARIIALRREHPDITFTQNPGGGEFNSPTMGAVPDLHGRRRRGHGAVRGVGQERRSAVNPQELPAGRELDALIRTHAFGGAHIMDDHDVDLWPPERMELPPLPCYSNDIRAAWMVVEKLDGMKGRGFALWLVTAAVFDTTGYMSGWNASFVSHWPDDYYGRNEKTDAEARTAPLAICRAAILALGVE